MADDVPIIKVFYDGIEEAFCLPLENAGNVSAIFGLNQDSIVGLKQRDTGVIFLEENWSKLQRGKTYHLILEQASRSSPLLDKVIVQTAAILSTAVYSENPQVNLMSMVCNTSVAGFLTGSI
jgi:hypothetical protein